MNIIYCSNLIFRLDLRQKNPNTNFEMIFTKNSSFCIYFTFLSCFHFKNYECSMCVQTHKCIVTTKIPDDDQQINIYFRGWKRRIVEWNKCVGIIGKYTSIKHHTNAHIQTKHCLPHSRKLYELVPSSFGKWPVNPPGASPQNTVEGRRRQQRNTQVRRKTILELF